MKLPQPFDTSNKFDISILSQKSFPHRVFSALSKNELGDLQHGNTCKESLQFLIAPSLKLRIRIIRETRIVSGKD